MSAVPSDPEDSRADSPSRAELRDATVTGIRWMAVARGLAEVAAFASLVVLAHLVSPAEYGRATIALIAPMLASIVTFEACGAALVQRASLRTAHLRTAALLAIATGLVLTAIAYLGAPLLADPLFGERTTELVQLASPTFLIAGIAAVPLARLQRELSFKRISLVEVLGVVSSAAASVALALAGLDGAAIVLGAVIGGALSTAVLVGMARPPLPALDRVALREIASFGVPAALQGLTWVAFRNVDYVIIGARLGAAQVGYYFRAFQFGVEYQGKISTVVVNLAFPVFSRTQDRQHMRALHGRMVRMHAVLIYPFLASLVALAPTLIPWLLGNPWAPAAAPAQILAVAGMAFVLVVGTGQVMLAAGHPRPVFAMNLASLVVYGSAIFLSAPHGLIAVSLTAAGVHLLMVLANYGLLLKRFLGIPLRSLWHHAAPATVASLALLAAELPLVASLDALGSPAIVSLSVSSLAGFTLYAATLRLVYPSAWRDCGDIARRVARRRSRTAGGPGAQLLAATAPVGAVAEASES